MTLQVGALITMGCVLSVDPKTEEILKTIEKDSAITKPVSREPNHNTSSGDCDDFEEGYSDDDMFVVSEGDSTKNDVQCGQYFSSWILDICFKNMGWTFRNGVVVVSFENVKQSEAARCSKPTIYFKTLFQLSDVCVALL